MKKKIIIISLILLIISIIIGLYGTFAASSTASGSDNTYAITLTGSTGEVVVPANSSKTVIYQITNTNKGVVQYAVAYSGTNITVKIYNNSQDSHTGIIDYGENKFIKLYIENSGDTDSTASIKTILGYEHGGSLDSLLPNGYNFISESYSPSVNFIKYITNLYTSGNPTLITQETSEDSYYYSYQDETQTWGLMNDGLKIATTSGTGSTTITDTTALTTGTEGNIRYFGPSESVNNYIYFNCSDYSSQSDSTCEKWRIIGIVDGKVKLIRNESIGKLAWDQDKNQDSSLTSYSNNWENSSLQLFLNGLYYNRGTTSNHTYYSGTDGSTIKSLDLLTIGITPATRNNRLISESTWYLSGYSTTSGLYSNDIYNYERTNIIGTTILDGNTHKINAKIGLMYPSDYGYGTNLTKCSNDISNYSSSTDTYACRANNWLFNGSNQWLITQRSSNSYDAWFVDWTGYIGYYYVYYDDFDVRPVLYLNPDLSIESVGDGSSSNPYQIYVPISNIEIYAGDNKLYSINGNICLDENCDTIMSTSENNIEIPSKEGYTFDGYYTEVDGTETLMIDSNGYATEDLLKYEFTENTTLYSKWVGNTYTINYYSNINYISEKDSVLVVLDGRTFYKYNAGGALVAYAYDNAYTGPVLVSENADAVAYYQSYDGAVNTYWGTFTYDGITYYYSSGDYWQGYNATDESGMNVTKYVVERDEVTENAARDVAEMLLEDNSYSVSQTLTYGTEQTLTKNTYTREGYYFVGWSTSPTGDVVYSDADSVMNLATSGTVNLYAVWKPNTYTVNYYSNTNYISEKDSVLVVLNERTFYKNSAGGALLAYAYDNAYTGPVLVSENADAVAYYQSYDGAVNNYGGTFSYNGKTYYYSSGGYWIQWNADNTSGMNVSKYWVPREEDSTVNTSRRVAEMLLEDNTYSVSQTLTYSKKISLTSNSYTREGYYFAGWSTSPTGDVVYSNSEKVVALAPSGTINLYAVWKQN